MNVDSHTKQQERTPSNDVDLPTVASTDLLKGSKTLIICHGDTRYRLQITRSQKLILTK